MTFSVAAYDPESRQWGVGVASRFLAVGAVVPWAMSGIGAVATQAWVNVSFGYEGLKLLKNHNAEEVVRLLVSGDSGREKRQLGIVDSRGNAFAFTGKECLDYAGHIIGEHYAIQGNILAGEKVLKGMERALAGKGDLAQRILMCLKAGEKEGGDRRGKQSCAILVVGEGSNFVEHTDRVFDIRVEGHEDPLEEMDRLMELWRAKFYSNRMMDYSDIREEVEKYLQKLGHDDLETWLKKNNFDDRFDGKVLDSMVYRVLRRSAEGKTK